MLSTFFTRLLPPPHDVGFRLQTHSLDYGHGHHYDSLFNEANLDQTPIERLCRRLAPQSVVDLGGGSGRIAVPLVEAGFHVTLIDYSADMLKKAEARRAKLAPEQQTRFRLKLGNICQLEEGTKYDLALSVNNAFEHLLGEQQILQAFQSVRGQVKAGSRFFFEVHNPEFWQSTAGWKKGAWSAFKHSYRIGGKSHYLWERTFPGAQDDHVVWEHAVTHNLWRFTLLRTEIQILNPEHWQALAHQAGWTVVGAWGNWDLEPLKKEHPKVIFELLR